LAVGDAAVTHDPLSSYGISFAIGSGIEAARAITETAAGGAGALRVYAELVGRSFAAFRRQQGLHYADERRWPHEPFWSRRHGMFKAGWDLAGRG
jgi:flavin-dependent dehydrogenase